jgi:hypothetical protein
MHEFETLNSRDREVLFYRELGSEDKAPVARCRRLRRMVLGRAPLAQCSFLLISSGGVEVPGWTTLAINDPGEDPWFGDRDTWDPALSSLGYSLTTTGGDSVRDRAQSHFQDGPAEAGSVG